jgi:hypothetical protein
MPKRQNQSRPRLEGPLAEPIVLSLLVVGLIAEGHRDCPAASKAVFEEAFNWIERLKYKKLLLLAERYGVDVSKRGGWQLVALRLAEEFLDGFRVVDHLPKGKGRPRGSGKIDRSRLGQAVDIEMAVAERVKATCGREPNKRSTVIEACRKLASDRKGPWKGSRPASLKTRYFEECREQNRIRNAPKSDFLTALEDAAARARKSCSRD